MGTKKIIICTGKYESFGFIISKLQAIGAIISKRNFDEDWKRYEIITELDAVQTEVMLDFVIPIGGVLLEAES